MNTFKEVKSPGKIWFKNPSKSCSQTRQKSEIFPIAALSTPGSLVLFKAAMRYGQKFWRYFLKFVEIALSNQSI